MSTTYIGTEKPSFWVKDSGGSTILSIASTDISYAPVYNRISRDKREETHVMANGKEKRYKAGAQYKGEIFYSAGMLTQAVIDKLIDIDGYDGTSGYTCYIKPREDGSLTGECIIDIDFSYKNDLTDNGVDVTITWRLSELV